MAKVSLPLGDVERGPGLVEDLEDAHRLGDLLGGDLQCLHLAVEEPYQGVDGLELGLDRPNALGEQVARAAARLVAEAAHELVGLGAQGEALGLRLGALLLDACPQRCGGRARGAWRQWLGDATSQSTRSNR